MFHCLGDDHSVEGIAVMMGQRLRTQYMCESSIGTKIMPACSIRSNRKWTEDSGIASLPLAVLADSSQMEALLTKSSFWSSSRSW
jgi:hypothetical protein